jgi:purine-binding chemotaxis protein CheW
LADEQAQAGGDADPLDELLDEAEAARIQALRADLGDVFQIIRFTSGGKGFALPINCVERTEKIPPTTPVPQAPLFIQGIAALRGGVVCVLDLARLLGHGDSADEWRSLLVIAAGGRRLGILSDTLPDFERIDAEELLGIPPGDRELYSGALERVTGLIGLLDPVKLLDHLEQQLANAVR